jgi:hypothetical protein
MSNKKVLDEIGPGILERKVEFLNFFLDSDTLYFLDPIRILLADNDDDDGGEEIPAYIKEAHAAINSYCNVVGKKLCTTSEEDIAEEFASFSKNAQECNFIHLGYGNNANRGRGTGEENFDLVLSQLKQHDNLPSVQQYSLAIMPMIIPKFGNDRMSDVLGKVIFLALLHFSEEMIKKYNLHVQMLDIDTTYWDTSTNQFVEKKVSMPSLPDRKFVFLLVPKAFVGGSVLNSANRVAVVYVAKKIQERYERTNDPRCREVKDKFGNVIGHKPPHKKDVIRFEEEDKNVDVRGLIIALMTENPKLFIKEYLEIEEKLFEKRKARDARRQNHQ